MALLKLGNSPIQNWGIFEAEIGEKCLTKHTKIAFCHAKPAADALVLVHMRTLPVYFNHFHRADLHALTAGVASV